MKHLLANITLLTLLLTAPLAWGCSNSDNCQNEEGRAEELAQPVPDYALTPQSQPKIRVRGLTDQESSRDEGDTQKISNPTGKNAPPVATPPQKRCPDGSC